MENMEGRLRDTTANVKRLNTCLIGLWKGKERKNETNVIFEEITGESVPRLMKVHWISSRISKTDSIPRYIVVKL